MALQAGDVVVRTITQNAEGTSAMMLSPPANRAPEGVRAYVADAQVQDVVERGDFAPQRTDQIKYQFAQPGSFSLPDLTFQWWDPVQEKLLNQELPGLNVDVSQAGGLVSETAPPPPQTSWRRNGLLLALVLLSLAMIVALLRRPLARAIAAWRAHRHRPGAVAAGKLRVACAANDPAAAFAAWMAWLAARRASAGWANTERLLQREQNRELRQQCQVLSRELFGPSSAATAWNGGPFWSAFIRSQRLLNHRPRPAHTSTLPALNPTSAAESEQVQ